MSKSKRIPYSSAGRSADTNGALATSAEPTAAPLLLRSIALLAFAVPANMVIAPLGAAGSVGMVLALVLFALWAASIAFGLHDPIPARHPARVALAIVWLATVVSYVQMSAGPATLAGKASADRWMLMLLAITAVILVTTERVGTLAAALSLVRALIAGAVICAAVATVQFVFGTDPWVPLRPFLFGLTDNGGATTFQVRGVLLRVAGTTFTPIELGVVSAMVLPLAVWRAMFDDRGRQWWHWVQCASIFFAAVCTISRSAVLGLLVCAVVFIPFLPRTARRWSVVCVPVAVVGLFTVVPGLIATMFSIVSADSTSDPSLATRLNNYPLVEAAVVRRPVAGTGPGTYLPDDALRILDNQYLHSAVEMGIFGILAMVGFFAVPAISALAAARYLRDPAWRCLAGAVAAGGFVAGASAATFDALSFPVFTLVYPFVVGLSGTVWIAARRAPESKRSPIEGVL